MTSLTCIFQLSKALWQSICYHSRDSIINDYFLMFRSEEYREADLIVFDSCSKGIGII